ncbi:hypothetical protein GcM1_237107 [Golovinomyces cichoracearum]|uniref:Uncharacterized protein n=1 Tax=Golovinomyces cichoracearum TaxID=62708 RepID=A0A420IK28_9PEZI|nr:hypothetical protein GcM1_237107 [Golovinomyces cichoracearum]
MSCHSLSPGAALLRRSKVFAIPKPLPRQIDVSSNVQTVSKTATTPYPTHLSITTPLSSLKEGDWGLKRPLPLRTTTQTSSPSVRIEAIDTIDKVTSFRSSGDHALTLQKWQELSIPITSIKYLPDDTNPIRRSVFEDEVDNLELHPDNSNSGQEKKTRWKFKGPWLGGQNCGEFSEYLITYVKGHKKEFLDYLRKEYAKSKAADARRKFIIDGAEGEAPVYKSSDITDEEFDFHVKELRLGRVELYKKIRTFLDLPPPTYQDLNDPTLDLHMLFAEKSDDKTEEQKKKQNLPRTGPPKTHPSAGISYCRSSSYTFLHPEFGPQEKKPPIQARVILPKNVSKSNSRTALIGFAGIVSGIPTGIESQAFGYRKGFRITTEFNYSRFPGLSYLDANEETGSKSWIHPLYAEVDSKGHLQTSWELGDPEAVAVRTDTVDELAREPVPIKFDANYWNRSLRSTKTTSTSTKPQFSTAKSYGLDSMLNSEVKKPQDDETLNELENILSGAGGI